MRCAARGATRHKRCRGAVLPVCYDKREVPLCFRARHLFLERRGPFAWNPPSALRIYWRALSAISRIDQAIREMRKALTRR